MSERERTHWEGCWRAHFDCAVARCERLEKQRKLRRLRGAVELEKRCERLTEAITDAMPDLEYALSQLEQDSAGCSAVGDQETAIHRLKIAIGDTP